MNLTSALESTLARAPRANATQAGAHAESEPQVSSPSDAGLDAPSRDDTTPDRRPGRGAGSEDGSKQIQLGKQLEEMGKINAILGHRDQTISGTATVEVHSGRPEVTTPYDARDAAHGAVTSAERDQIPLEFETYVQQYFQHLQKHPAAVQKMSRSALDIHLP